MNIINYLNNVSKIVRKKKNKNRVVISLAGAGCIGKSTFAERYSNYVGKNECEIVELDGYMLERSIREKLGNITGYNPQGFELDKARRQLAALILSDTPFVLYKYNRFTHKRDIYQLIEPKDTILIEGGLSLHENLFDLADVHVFLDSSKDDQFLFRFKREQREFKSDMAEVKDRFERYYPDYEEFIMPKRIVSDIILRVDSNYDIQFVSNNENVIIEGLKGIIYDMDGVLIDSKKANVEYYNSILLYFGKPKLTPHQEDLCHTLSANETIKSLFPNDDSGVAFKYKKSNPMVNFLDLILLMPDVYETLSMLANEFCMSIATSRSSTLDKIIEKFRFSDYFGKNIFSVRDVERPKPNAKLLLYTAKKMRVDIESSIYIGDNISDYKCSKNAGAHYCAFRHIVEGELNVEQHHEFIPLVKTVKSYKKITG